MKKFISLLFVTVMLFGFVSVPAYGTAEEYCAGRVDVDWGSLNVRASAGTDSPVVASLQKNSLVTLLGQSGDWWRVEYAAGRYGYCHGDYISCISNAYKAYVATSRYSLNVRSGPGTGYGVVGGLDKGQSVVVLEKSGSWCRVLYGGCKTGWASGEYISKSGGEKKYTAVSLDVPAYSQTDPRWAGVKLGSSTMGKIGCATTAIAMAESYLAGREINPAEMSYKLGYTSGGSVYWPANYRACFDKNSFMEEIYSELAAGRPVLVGAKNYGGGQHWVVVTGYLGGDGLSEYSFAINDPGSSTRKTLGSFFEDYPVFYKFFKLS